MSRYLGVITRNGEQFLNTTYYYGTNPSMECLARGILAMVTSDITCFSFRFPFWLDIIGFGYISSFLSAAIIVVSFIAKVKDSYKLFILSQAVWNLFISYDFICNKPSYQYFVNADPQVASILWNQGPPTCFYSTTDGSPSWAYFLKQIVLKTLQYMPFFQVFNLSLSRFLALYKQNLYSRLNKIKRAAIYIIVFNVIAFFIINSKPIYDQANHLIALSACNCSNCPVYDTCVRKYFGEADKNAKFITSGIPPIFSLILLPLTALMTIAICAKVYWQLKFAYNHNQKNLAATSRLAVMMVLQFLIAVFIFVFIFFGEFLQVWVYSLFLKIGGAEAAVPVTNVTPTWVKVLNDGQASLNVLRAVFESVNVFIILSDYRKGVGTVFYSIIHPKQTLYNIKKSTPTITMTTVQPFNNSQLSQRR